MEFRVLGPLEVVPTDDAPVRVPPKQAALLALLLIHAGTVLSVDRILEELWGEDQPKTGVRTLRFHVHKLRELLQPDRTDRARDGILITHGRGYAIEPEPSEIDALRFVTLSNEGRALVESAPGEASSILRTALDMWRGPAYADFQYESFAQAEIARLEGLRIRTLEDRIAADLNSGLHHQIVPELQQLSVEHPMRERLVGLLMIALYRSGQQAAALSAYADTRQRLVEELGIEPSPWLQDLEQKVLQQSEDLTLGTGRRRRMNLPSPQTELVDRQKDVARVVDLIGERRLVTLLGPGGVGKTRVALAVAADMVEDFSDGVWYVGLTDLRTTDEITTAISDAVGFREQRPGRDSLTELVGHLEKRNGLLVLDRGEHVVSSLDPVCRAIHREAPGVHCLVTSRERMRLPGEGVWHVKPLALPNEPTPSSIAASPAAQLFVARARDSNQAFELTNANGSTVAAIVQRLDGIPLAIELAASRLGVLPLEGMVDRLADRLSLRDRSAVDGGATLRATFDWSHELLTPDEQVLLRRLAVFRGRFALESVEAICARSPIEPYEVVDLLERLIDTSFVKQSLRSPGRLRLFDTIREYALEKLAAAGETSDLRERHAQHFADEARREAQRARRASDPAWLQRLERDRSNFAAACEYALSTKNAKLALRLTANLGRFWFERGYHTEARSMLEAALEIAPDESRPDTALALAELSMLALFNGDPDTAQALGDRATKAAASIDDVAVDARSDRLRATLAWGEGNYRLAAECEIKALEKLRGVDDLGAGTVTGQVAYLLRQTGHTIEAEVYADELRRKRDQPEFEAAQLEMTGWFELLDGRNSQAAEVWRRAAESYDSLALVANAIYVRLLAGWALFESDLFDEALTLANEALADSRINTIPFLEARAEALVAWITACCAEPDSDKRWLYRSLRRTHKHRDHYWTYCVLSVVAQLAAGDGHREAGVRVAALCRELQHAMGVVAPPAVEQRLADIAPTPPSPQGDEPDFAETHELSEAAVELAAEALGGT